MKYIFVLSALAFQILLSSSLCAGDVIKYNGVPVKGRAQIYAHMAGRGLMPEQTMPAYRHALRLGVDYVDMDIAMTKDGVIVITHDLILNQNLTRDPDGNWITDRILVKDLTLKELQKYDVGRLKPGTKYASYFPHQIPVDLTPIPTLKEAVSFVKSVAGDSVGFQIEMKTDPSQPELAPVPKEFAEALYKLMKEEEIIDRTEVQAFDWRCLIELKKIDGNVKTAFLSDHTTISLDDSEKGTWTAGCLPRDFGYSLPRMVKSLGGDCWEPFEKNLTEEALIQARGLGLKVVVWGWPEEEGTEFDYEQVNKMIEWGVDGIISDRPDILRGLMAARGFDLPKGFSLND